MGCNTTVGVYEPAGNGDYGHLRDLDDEFPGGDIRGWGVFNILRGKTVGSETQGANPFVSARPDDVYDFSYHYDVEKLRANVMLAFPEGNETYERFVDAAEAAQKKYGLDRAVITEYL